VRLGQVKRGYVTFGNGLGKVRFGWVSKGKVRLGWVV
jgi:hypothetical protein